jgi:hypothetical protein
MSRRAAIIILDRLVCAETKKPIAIVVPNKELDIYGKRGKMSQCWLYSLLSRDTGNKVIRASILE